MLRQTYTGLVLQYLSVPHLIQLVVFATLGFSPVGSVNHYVVLSLVSEFSAFEVAYKIRAEANIVFPITIILKSFLFPPRRIEGYEDKTIGKICVNLNYKKCSQNVIIRYLI